jgi:hypothetical protein
MKADRGWKRAFDDPIDMPNGRKLVTLQDAGDYITKLPKAEHSAPEWQDADGSPAARRNARRTDDAGADRPYAGASFRIVV